MIELRILIETYRRILEARSKGYATLEIPSIQFTMSWDIYGCCEVFDDDSITLSFNLLYAKEDWQFYVDIVIPHEVAHYIQYKCLKDQSLHYHGKVWKNIMNDVYNIKTRYSQEIVANNK